MAALSMPYCSIKRRTVCEGNSVITKTILSRTVSSTAIRSLRPASRISMPIAIKNVDVLHRDVYGAFKIKDEGLEKEMQGTIQRLEEVVERIKELEMQKFMGRVRGTEFEKDGVVLAETMSQEIACKFLESPIKYLRSCNGNQDEKLKDINVLVGILEKSTFDSRSCPCIGVKNP
ncbi:hypothetical protein HS088_TW18G00190 [Tripterygium wilfordii]|uniref:Tetrapyrrole biosynthesis glutamyl-tRNA reductase dimerisation domain-containing protein n=1 Tax=Tripterygium wilfordii TaxID=458696 RepID=A0A7J7CBN5_TRIWF|nr:hypothetical protein HS088_TW18G00190 [Tripterygium wilfordii]